VLGSVEDARDVAQNVFIRLAERGFSPDKTRNLKGYLYSAATKHVICVVRWREIESIDEFEHMMHAAA